MSFNPNDNLPQDASQLKPLKGIVVGVKDPLKLCRVQCKIEGLHEPADVKSAYWFKPKSRGVSGRVDYGTFQVPELYSIVKISFPDNNLLNGEYEANADDTTDNTQTRLFDEDYPKSEGTCDATGSWTRTNKEQQYEEHLHSSGYYTQVDKEGNLHVWVPKSVIVHIGENLFIKMDKNLGIQVGESTGITTAQATGIKTGTSMELLANVGTWEAQGGLDLNTGVVFGTADAIKSSMEDPIKKVDDRNKDMKELQKQILEAGKAAIESIKTMSEGLKGTRSE
jgi:hypothetical protein